ncbi:disease resistance protein RGA5-like [Miscanthus floridulus]|uniref:disease resistance protein RGA5-like n=1 Tax=Miscanthus floridulus TaxID=154761 RepID=UPI0034583FE4
MMGPVLDKLASLVEKYTELKNVRKKMEQLRKELIAINLALEKHAAMESPDAQAKAWAAEMRELAYDLEDSIDLFTHHVDHEPPDTTTGVKRFFLRMIRKLKKLHYRHRFAQEIKELHDLANESYRRRKRYRIEEGGSSISHAEIDPRLQALYVEVEKLVGIQGPSQEIIGRLVGENPPVERQRVVAIVGSGGSGKTTLAKQVYEKIRGQFSCAAFVSVSQKPNMISLLWEFLSQIGSNGGDLGLMAIGSRSEKQLIDSLRSHLKNQRYLVVIDDVWTKSAWETIQCALPNNGHTSKVIMTTRINSVGQFSCASDEGFIYQMKPLSRNDSEKLFLKRTLCDEDEFPVQLEGIKDEIIEKCDGLPLAIVTLASMIATKPRTEEEWERALNSIHSMHEKDSGLEVIDKILSLSYSDLPHNMRNCLLYLSTFPEDHMIYKDILVWRWIAEGFIAEKQGFTLEQVAESYFYEFVNRSLVQPITLRSRYETRGEGGCRVHDIVLNFLISRSTEENFLTMLYGQGVPSSDQRIRRLSVWDNPEHALAVSRETMNLSHLRSVSICNVGGWTMPPVLDLPVLRVLDLEGCRDLRIVDPDCILSLFHLRYLGFCSASGVVLPDQIGNLHYLQTIDLSGTGVTQLPESIVRLKRLMLLIGQRLIMPDGFGNMESLQELGTIDCWKCSINFGEDLALLSRLRVLRVTFIGLETSDMETRKKSLMSSLCKLGGNNLRHVTIDDHVGGGDCFVDSWYPPPRLLQKFIHISQYFSRFPKWISSCLCDLTHLDIKVEKMEQEYLRILEDLPAIRSLYLFVKQVSEDGLIISRGAFRCLRRFEFCNIDGPGLIFEGGMRMLEWLRLGFDADKAQSTYGSLEVGIHHLSSLKHIVLIVWMISEGGNDPVEEAVKSVISGLKMLPNSPTLDIRFRRRSRLAGTE